jgi:hypothetical protein
MIWGVRYDSIDSVSKIDSHFLGASSWMIRLATNSSPSLFTPTIDSSMLCGRSFLITDRRRKWPRNSGTRTTRSGSWSSEFDSIVRPTRHSASPLPRTIPSYGISLCSPKSSSHETLDFMRFGEFCLLFGARLEFQRERFAYERFCSLQLKAVNHSEYFPMARQFRGQRLTDELQRADSDGVSWSVCRIWQPSSSTDRSRAGESQIAAGSQRGKNILLP